MKKKLSRVLAVLLGVLMLAVCIPAAAFAEETEATGDITVELHIWMPMADYMDHVALPTNAMWVTVAPWGNEEKCNEVYKTFVLTDDSNETLPAEIDGCKVYSWSSGWGGNAYLTGKPFTKASVANDRTLEKNGGTKLVLYAFVPGLYPEPARTELTEYIEKENSYIPTPTPAPAEDKKDTDTTTSTATPAPTAQPAAPAATTFVPQLQSQSSEPAVTVDTRTEQQKEIDEAIANGTWGIEYTTCQKCGYHNWTRQGNVYVCDTCGNTTTEVVSAKGVKGYVGSGAIAAVAPGKTVDDTPKYATAKEAQAAADKREAAYAAAVAAFQKQIAEQNAAYLASLK